MATQGRLNRLLDDVAQIHGTAGGFVNKDERRNPLIPLNPDGSDQGQINFIREHGNPRPRVAGRFASPDWVAVSSSWIAQISHDSGVGSTYISTIDKASMYAYPDSLGNSFAYMADAALRGGSVGKAWWHEFRDDREDNFYYMGKAK